jgi:predicted ATPase/signal transduction histidine kinase
VVLKVVRRADLAADERLENELRMSTQLGSSAVAQAVGIDRFEGMPALVLEDFGAKSLRQLLGKPMRPERFLRIAIAAATALAELHARGVIHRDINPENILLNEATGDLKLTDLGIATLLPRQQRPTHNPALIEGTLAYMSPEQTGRMNRAVDQRSDLYSLGVTFYYMLTGRLPFAPSDSSDPLEWVHCHIARLPQPPSELVSSVPPPLSDIVMKLLSKAPDDRYQSAAGLRDDLQKCLSTLESTGGLTRFELGQRDLDERFHLPQKLYGRERELGALLEAFDRVAKRGEPELVLVSGYSGVGKSTLVQELHKPVVEQRGFFITGKFDSQRRNIPYSSLAQALRDLVLDILSESDEQIEQWRARLNGALGANAQLIIDVIPEVELIIGRQPPVVELAPREAKLRFRLVFQRFIGAFTAAEHPLVLFIDDLQWADPASIEMLEQIATSPEIKYLLVIGAYRENEVDGAHPLMHAVERIGEAHRIGAELRLAPLSIDCLRDLITDTVHSRKQDAEALAQLVHQKTAGNPFFVIQFLNRIYEDGLIALDRQARAWRWDVTQIGAHEYTDNVVELMVAKLRRLSDTTGAAVTLAACLDNIDAQTLALISGRTEEQLKNDLYQCVREGLMRQEGNTFHFVHDRIRQAASSLLPDDERADAHLRIGRLLRQCPSQDKGESLFEVASHLLLGAGRIVDGDEIAEVAEFFLRAGRKAKAATAFESAQQFLAAGVELLSRLSTDCWEAQYRLTFDLRFELADCEWISGSWEDTESQLGVLLEHAKSKLDRLAVHGLRTKLHSIRGEWNKALESARHGLQLVGVDWSDHARFDQVQAAYDRVWACLGDRHIGELIDLPPMTDPEMKAAMAIASVATGAATFTDAYLVALVACFMVDTSLRYGNAESSAHGYALFGMISGLFGRYGQGYRFGRLAYDLIERNQIVAYKARVFYYVGNVINFWVRPYRTGIEYVEAGVRSGAEIGDILASSYCSVSDAVLRYLSGETLAVFQREVERLLVNVRRFKFDDIADLINCLRQCALNLRGQTPDLSSLNGEGFDEAVFEQHRNRPLINCWYFIFKTHVRVMMGDYGEAVRASQRAKELLWTNHWFPSFPEFHFAHAIALAAWYREVSAADQKEYLTTLVEIEQKLSVWAAGCPANFASKHALVAAEIARLQSNKSEAMRLYEQAIHAAREGGLVQNEALAYEIAARFYKEQGSPFAEQYLREARSCYLRWGASGKVRRLEQANPALAGEGGRFVPTVSFAARVEQIDLLSVVRASQAISREVVVDKLLRALIEVVLAQSGAEKGFLIFPRDGALWIEAQAALKERGSKIETQRALPITSSDQVARSVVNYVYRTRESVVLDDATVQTRFSEDQYIMRTRPRSLLCLPILRQAEVVGLLYLENNVLPGAFTPGHLTVLELLAAQAAISLENARLMESERAARAFAESAEQRAAFLAEATRLLNESLDIQVVLERLAKLVVQFIGEWCNIDLLEDKQIHRVAGAHVDPSKQVLLDELRRRYPPQWDTPHPATSAIKDGRASLEPELSDDDLRRRTVDEEHFHIVSALGARSGIAVPLVVHGNVLGAITLGNSGRGRRFDRADLELTEELASRAATAIDNARLYRQTQEAVRVREDFLSVASHELNTPVTVLMLNLQAMLEGVSNRTVEPEGLLLMTRRAERQGRRLTGLIGTLLDVTRIEREQLSLDREQVNLTSLVRDTVSRLEPQLERVGCTLVLELAESVGGFWDPQRLEQVITNLLDNAAKFGSGKPIEVTLEHVDGRARLSVRDRGIGIDPDRRQSIFNRFERGVSARHYGGLGLGLYICRRIVEAHDGTIGVESQLGEGARFTVELPCTARP